MRGSSRLNVTVHWDASFGVSPGACPLFISVHETVSTTVEKGDD